MIEKILSIKDQSWANNDGFIITTSRQEIKLGISNGQSCCENWGYFMSNDNIDEFIGAKLIDVEIVNECLFKERLEDTYGGNTMFVNINTSIGTLQFTAYNEHNGYYGHYATVVSNRFSHETVL